MTQPRSTTNDVIPQRRLNLVVLAIMIAMTLAMLDNLIVGTAMPTIVAQLGGLDRLSWVITAYTLATAASTPIWGKLGDMYGRKGIYLTSIATFLVGSALSGASQSMNELVAFRALQGLGAGGLMVGAYSIMGVVIPSRQRGKYQGMMSIVMGAAMVGGPLVGGALTDHAGWRWGFYINLPIGAVAALLLISALRLPKTRSTARIDYLGSILLTATISAVVLVTSWGGTRYAWDSPVIVTLSVLAVAMGAVLPMVERRVAQPVLPLHIFRSGNFSLVTLMGFLLGFAMFGAMTFLPLFQQTVKGNSATNSGLLLLPMIVAQIIVNVVAGRIITKTGKYKVFVILGGALIVPGLFLMAGMDTGTSAPATSLYMALFGAGMGFLMQTTMLIALDSAEMKDRGVASSTATLARTIGGAFGVSLMGVLFANQVQQIMARHGSAAAAAVQGRSAQLDAADLARLPEAVRTAYQNAVAGGTHQVFLVAGIVSVITFAAAWFIDEVPLRGTPVPQPKADAAPGGGRTESAPAT